MGKEQTQVKAVLDTNVLISALLHGGRPGELIPLWKTSRLRLGATQPCLDEYARVLSYPKFGYSTELIAALLSEALLPWVERVEPKKAMWKPEVRDPNDLPFLLAAYIFKADVLITGDKDLLALAGTCPFEILKPADLLDRFQKKQ